MPDHRIPDAIGRPPEDFAAVLAADEPLFLVGGQAVNLWALYYQDRTANLAPFVSRDVDVLGNRETLSRLAATMGVKPQFFPMRPPTNEVGVLIAKSTGGSPLIIEVLSHVHGIGNDDLREPAYTIAIGTTGVSVRVPGPIALLQAKIANAADLSQTGRQDTRHVRILAQLMPAYLKNIQTTVGANRSGVRTFVNLLERLLTAVTSTKGRKVLRDLGINPQTLFSEIDATASAKLHAFMTKRLPQVLAG